MDETIKIIIEGESKSAGEAVDSASSGLTGLGAVAGTVATGGLALAAGALIGIGTAAVGAGAAALSVASDVNNATNQIATQLGISQEAASGFEGVMKDIFANNFGEDFDDIAASISEVVKQLGQDISDEELQSVTEQALALRDAFDIEVSETMGAVNTLMRDFGLTSQEALDFVTKGLQTIPADDFLDSITEYGPQFNDLELDAGSFFSAMETGMADGVLGTDKVLDMFKEMRLKLADLEGATGDALVELGEMSGAFDGQKLIEDLQSGKIGMDEYFALVQEGLAGVTLDADQTRLGAAILGTQFEDLGSQATLAVDLAKTSMEDLSGATETLNAQYDNFGAMWEGIKRQALVALEPLGSALLDLGESVMPLVTDFMSNTLQPALEGIGGFITGTVVPSFNSFVEKLQLLGTIIQGMFDGDPMALEVLGQQFGPLAPVIELVVANFQRFWEAGQQLADIFTGTVLPVLQTAFGWLQGEGSGVITAIGFLFQAQPTIISFAIGAIVDAISWLVETLKSAWGTITAAFEESNLGESIEALKGAFVALWEALQPVFAGIGEIITTNFATLTDVMGGVFGETDEAVNWSGILVNLFNVIALAIADFAADVQTIAEAISAFWAEHGDSIIEFVTGAYTIIANIIGTSITVIKKVVTFFLNLLGKDWGKTFGSLGKLTDVAWKLVQKLFNAAIKFLIKLVASWLAEKIKTITKAWDTIKETFKVAWNFIQDLIETVTAAILQIITTWMEAIRKVIDTVLRIIQNIWETIWNAIKAFIDTVMTAIRNIIESAMNAIRQIVDTVLNAIRTLFETVMNAIRTIVDTAMNAIRTIFDTVMNAIRTIVDTALNAIENLFNTVMNAIRTIVDTVLTAIENLFGVSMESIRQIVDSVLSAIETLFNSVMDAIRGAVENALNAIESIFNSVMSSIQGLVDNILSAIQSAFDNAMSAIEGIVDSAFSAIEGIIQGAMDAIQGIISGGWDSVNAAVQTAFDAMSGIAQTGMDAVNAVVDTALQALAALMAVGSAAYNSILGIGQSIADAIKAGFDAVTNFVDGIISTLTAWLNSVGVAILGAGSSAITLGGKIVDAILNGIGSFTTFVSDMVADLSGWIGQVLAGVTSKLEELGGDMIDKILNKMLVDLPSWLNSFTTAIQDFIDDAICFVIGCSPRGSITDRLKKAGGKIVSSLLSGVTESKDRFKMGIKDSVESGIMGGLEGIDPSGLIGGLEIPAAITGIDSGFGGFGFDGGILPNLAGVGTSTGGGNQTILYINNKFETTINSDTDEEEFVTKVSDAIEIIVERNT